MQVRQLHMRSATICANATSTAIVLGVELPAFGVRESSESSRVAITHG
jgi:hypothetical protein